MIERWLLKNICLTISFSLSYRHDSPLWWSCWHNSPLWLSCWHSSPSWWHYRHKSPLWLSWRHNSPLRWSCRHNSPLWLSCQHSSPLWLSCRHNTPLWLSCRHNSPLWWSCRDNSINSPLWWSCRERHSLPKIWLDMKHHKRSVSTLYLLVRLVAWFELGLMRGAHTQNRSPPRPGFESTELFLNLSFSRCLTLTTDVDKDICHLLLRWIKITW